MGKRIMKWLSDIIVDMFAVVTSPVAFLVIIAYRYLPKRQKGE